MQQKICMPSIKLIYFQIPTQNPAQQLPADCSKCKENILVRFVVFRVQAVAPTQDRLGVGVWERSRVASENSLVKKMIDRRK